MAGPNLPVNVDTTYADSGADASVKVHQQHHDALHTNANRFDKDVAPTDGQALIWSASLGLWVPTTLSTAVTAAQQAKFDQRDIRLFYNGTAWPTRPADAPTSGVQWDSQLYPAMTAGPPAGTTAAHDGDNWWPHYSIV